MVTTHNLGFPRIGRKRELKFALESYWKKAISQEDLLKTARELRSRHWRDQSKLDWVPVGDFSLYDHVLDTSFLLGNVPERMRVLSGAKLDHYFRAARGRAAADRIAFGDGPLAGVELLVEGNRAHLTGKTGNLLTFDIVHGGDALAFVVVGQEDYDLSDISLGLGTASMVPVPAAAWLFGSAVLTLTGIARRRRVGRL